MRLRGYLKTVPLLLAAAVWPATALGGNPHGTPPGQQKKETGSTNAHVSVHAHGKAKAHGHGHASGSVTVHARGHAHASAGAGATVQAGVKSSSSTAKSTFAAASSNQTKLYGNGQTAGQIAMAHGAQANAVLYGPGNGQPHKVSCGAHWIDVHALKAHAGVCAGAAAGMNAHAGVKASASGGFNMFAAASSNQTKLYGNGQTAGQIAIQAGFGAAILFGPGNSQPHKVACGAHLIDVHALKAHAGACAGVLGSQQASTGVSAQTQVTAQVQAAAHAQTQAGVAAKSSGGGVLGASAARPSNRSAGAGGLLGAAARSGALPFTGQPLLAALVFGPALLAGGFGLRRLARAHS